MLSKWTLYLFYVVAVAASCLYFHPSFFDWYQTLAGMAQKTVMFGAVFGMVMGGVLALLGGKWTADSNDFSIHMPLSLLFGMLSALCMYTARHFLGFYSAELFLLPFAIAYPICYLLVFFFVYLLVVSLRIEAYEAQFGK